MPSENGKLYMVTWPKHGRIHGAHFVKVSDTEMRRALGFNEFDEELTEIPEGAKFKETNDRSRRYYLREAVPDPKIDGGLELQNWKLAVRAECITISDILNLEPGDKIKFLVMDRNLEDVTNNPDQNQPDTLIEPDEFFRDNWAIYTHVSELHGKIEWAFGLKRDFEFEIEYRTKPCPFWYPLFDGSLPPHDPQQFSNLGEFGGKHYSEFPTSTRIGWRGPMILWERLPSLPRVYWHDDVSKDDV